MYIEIGNHSKTSEGRCTYPVGPFMPLVLKYMNSIYGFHLKSTKHFTTFSPFFTITWCANL